MLCARHLVPKKLLHAKRVMKKKKVKMFTHLARRKLQKYTQRRRVFKNYSLMHLHNPLSPLAVNSTKIIRCFGPPKKSHLSFEYLFKSPNFHFITRVNRTFYDLSICTYLLKRWTVNHVLGLKNKKNL